MEKCQIFTEIKLKIANLEEMEELNVLFQPTMQIVEHVQ